MITRSSLATSALQAPASLAPRPMALMTRYMYYGPQDYELPSLPSDCVIIDLEEEELRLSRLQVVVYEPAAAAWPPLRGNPIAGVASNGPSCDSCSSASASAQQVPSSSSSFASKLRAGAMGLGAKLAGACRALVAKLLRVIKPRHA